MLLGCSQWNVARGAVEAAPWITALARLGLDARALPCIERAPLAWPDVLVPADAGRTVVVCTSGYAARLVAERRAQARWGEDVVLAAVAPATAAVLAAASVPVEISARGGSVALARAIVQAASATNDHRHAATTTTRVLYPTSDQGMQQPEQRDALALLSTVSGDVRRAAVYTTTPAPGLAPAVARLPRPAGLVFFSPSAVDAFVDVADAGLLASACAVCVGESSARAWQRRTGTTGVLVHGEDELPDLRRAAPSSTANTEVR